MGHGIKDIYRESINTEVLSEKESKSNKDRIEIFSHLIYGLNSQL